MQSNRFKPVLALFFAIVAVMLIDVPDAETSPNYKVLHAFTGGTDGGGLYGGVVRDTHGYLYGVTSGGGDRGYGTIFQLAPHRDGEWPETVIYSFCADPPLCTDGALPRDTLAIDAVGNLYGPSSTGGPENVGSLFQLAPGSGGWTFTLLADIGSPPLIVGIKGNLYGEIGPGKCNGGDILKLDPPPDGGYWISKDLYDFCMHNGRWSKGNSANYGLSWDAVGNLYGVTDAGGKANFGVVFQLEHTPSGWKEHVLHSFGGAPDGEFVQGSVVVDDQGRVYGTTEHGGTGCGGGQGCGTIYQLTHQPDGHWKEKILRDFPSTKNGSDPLGALAIDAAGNLYGVANGGGGPCGGGGCGVVYKMIHNADDSFTYKVLHRFQGTDGLAPVAGVILDGKGNLYGTTSTGGKGDYGVVFKITQ